MKTRVQVSMPELSRLKKMRVEIDSVVQRGKKPNDSEEVVEFEPLGRLTRVLHRHSQGIWCELV